MSTNPNLYVNKTHFQITHFETEAKDNSERAITGKHTVSRPKAKLTKLLVPIFSMQFILKYSSSKYSWLNQ